MKSAVVVTSVVFLALTGHSAGQERRQPDGPKVDRAASFHALVENERAFSRLSGRLGQAAAFLAYFGDEVVTFHPQPAVGKEVLRRQAASVPVPPTRNLDWEPWFADVSVSGDLGYTTGPVVAADVTTGKTLFTGWYFSVWRKGPGGWHVASDIGTGGPPVGAIRAGKETPREVTMPPVGRVRPAGTVGGEDLQGVERAWEAGRAGRETAAVSRPPLAADVRFYRDGVAPIVGREAVLELLAKESRPARCAAVRAEVASSGELGWSFGTCEAAGGGATARSFLHVWKTDSEGWKLQAEVMPGK